MTWRNFCCSLSFHKWMYSDYHASIYVASETRTCTNCGQREQCHYPLTTSDGTFVIKSGSLPKK